MGRCDGLVVSKPNALQIQRKMFESFSTQEYKYFPKKLSGILQELVGSPVLISGEIVI